MAFGLVLAGVSAGLSAASAIARGLAEDKQRRELLRAAKENRELRLQDLASRRAQEEAAAAQELYGIAQEALGLTAQANVSRAESGTARASYQRMLDNIESSLFGAQRAALRNYGYTRDQLDRQQRSIYADERQQISGAGSSSPLPTLLGVAQAGIDFYSSVRARTP